MKLEFEYGNRQPRPCRAARVAISSALPGLIGVLFRSLLGPRALLIVIELLLQRRVVHADEEGGVLAGHTVLDQREHRRREGIPALPRKGPAIARRLAGARDHMMHRRSRPQRRQYRLARAQHHGGKT